MDRLVKGFAFDGQVRLVGIEATDLVQTALDIHKLSPVGIASLGKLLMAGAIMGSIMKNEQDKTAPVYIYPVVCKHGDMDICPLLRDVHGCYAN